MQKDFFELEVCVEQWAQDKGIFDKATPLKQGLKTKEEVDELIEALTAQSEGDETFINSKGIKVNTKDEIEDAIGDIIVTLIIQAKMQGVSIEKCLNGAYETIRNRTGKMIDGQFVKD